MDYAVDDGKRTTAQIGVKVRNKKGQIVAFGDDDVAERGVNVLGQHELMRPRGHDSEEKPKARTSSCKATTKKSWAKKAPAAKKPAAKPKTKEDETKQDETKQDEC